MRIQHAGRQHFNHREVMAAVRAGHAQAIINSFRERTGFAVDSAPGVAGEIRGILLRNVLDVYDQRGNVVGQMFDEGGSHGGFDTVAFDAQPELVTQANAGIPAFLSNYLDPKLIEVLVQPMEAAEIAGEQKRGDWTTTVTTFVVIESTGEVAAYGDYNNGGNADANANFPQRQSFHYQTFTAWGQKELAYAGLAGIDLGSRKNIASALVLNKFQNATYFYGVSGLQNYGLLNDPNLSAPIVPTVNWFSATAEQIYADVIRLYQQIVTQTGGNVKRNTRMTMALSPGNDANLTKSNQFGLNVFDYIKKNFPGINVKTAPEYATSSGELVQLIVDEYEGQETMTAAFTEKMRAHAMVTESSSFKQKKSQGTWGTVIFRPAMVAQMLG